MALKNLAIGLCCLTLFGGTFAAGVVLLKPKYRNHADVTSAGPATLESEFGDNARDVDKKLALEGSTTARSVKTAKNSAPASKTRANRPLTCMEATKLGTDSVGKRVTWVGKWTHSQSSGKGSKHTFDTQGPDGDFTFDYPFEAEDPKPLDRGQSGENVRERLDRTWGTARVVTVTGTISRVETLIFIGRGTRHDVPVLSDIQI